MIVLFAILAGAALGDRRARKAGGGRKDRIQYALAHALAFAIAGLFVTVLLDRSLRG